MDDFKMWLITGGGAAAAFGIGKWVLPMLSRMLDNALASVTAGGETLANVRSERDQLRALLSDLREKYDAMFREWAEMKARVGLMEYQLEEAQAQIAELKGIPPQPKGESHA
ncbi:hypothetical protein CAL29_28035 [Bordetella genomosp. 10]|uniref:Chemotaxis protein n=1 Tax=Bordetella genomosp. 10 TaxID=1416804 RepID=A0A261S303_9BORD|nr:hypothetical protein [Bordetella genomosp. 10]OZI31726.1 hypothetical protein CAL29_28035 [Bordetella genomosp. 10]